MIQPMQWRRSPKPDPSVVKLTKALDEAAARGDIRNCCVVTLNPMLQAEVDCAGELDEVRRDLLVGALTRLIRKISE